MLTIAKQAHILAAGAFVALSLFDLAQAASVELKPGVIYDLGGKYDHSFNENVFDGVKRWSDETKHPFVEFELRNETQREQAIRTIAESGADPVIAIGFAAKDALEEIAPDFPKTRFVIIDTEAKGANIQAITANYAEGSFLVGVVGAMASKSGKIGFVGGMDIPLIRSFSCGYHQGAHFARPDIAMLENMAGTTPEAWNDPAKGGELAKSQFDRGADVVFAAAGQTGTGVLRAASDDKKLAIGVGLNQNGLFPGSVLTSMVVHYDEVVYLMLKSAADGSWRPGHKVMGIKDGAVGWARDANNAALITPEIAAKAAAAKEAILSGAQSVVDYTAANSCPL